MDCINECSICKEDYKTYSNITIVKCNHNFHQNCIDQWIAKCYEESEKSTCPMCRTELNVNAKYLNPIWEPDSLQELKNAINEGYDLNANIHKWFHDFVAYVNNFEIFEYVINNVPNLISFITPTLFIRIAITLRIDYVKFLLERGYNDKNAIRRSFAKASHSSLINSFREEIRCRQCEIIKLLYDCDCITSSSKIRALIYAVRNNAVSLVKFYVSKGINLNYVDKYTIRYVKKNQYFHMMNYLKSNIKK